MFVVCPLIPPIATVTADIAGRVDRANCGQEVDRPWFGEGSVEHRRGALSPMSIDGSIRRPASWVAADTSPTQANVAADAANAHTNRRLFIVAPPFRTSTEGVVFTTRCRRSIRSLAEL